MNYKVEPNSNRLRNKKYCLLTNFRLKQKRKITVSIRSGEKDRFRTPSRAERFTYYDKRDSSPSKKSSQDKSQQKTVRFEKILSYEDLVVDTLKSINQQFSFKQSYIYDKIQRNFKLMEDSAQYGSAIKFSISAEKFMKTRRGFDPDDPYAEKTTRRTSKLLVVLF